MHRNGRYDVHRGRSERREEVDDRYSIDYEPPFLPISKPRLGKTYFMSNTAHHANQTHDSQTKIPHHFPQPVREFPLPPSHRYPAQPGKCKREGSETRLWQGVEEVIPPWRDTPLLSLALVEVVV